MDGQFDKTFNEYWFTWQSVVGNFCAAKDTMAFNTISYGVDDGFTPLVCGTVSLQSAQRPYDGFRLPLFAELFPNGDLSDPAIQNDIRNDVGRLLLTDGAVWPRMDEPNGTPTELASFDIPGIGVPPGLHILTLQESAPPHTLVTAKQDVTVASYISILDMCSLLEGDVDGNGSVDIFDFPVFKAGFGTKEGEPGFNAEADFDHNAEIDIFDFPLFKGNFDKKSPIVCGGTQASSAPGSVPLASGASAPANLYLIPPAPTVSVGQQFAMTIFIWTGTPVTGLDAFVDFDPFYLEVVDIVGGTALDIELASEYDNLADNLRVSSASFSDPTSVFVVATVTFKAKAATGATALTFNTQEPEDTAVVDANADDITGALNNAQVTITP